MNELSMRGILIQLGFFDEIGSMTVTLEYLFVRIFYRTLFLWNILLPIYVKLMIIRFIII